MDRVRPRQARGNQGGGPAKARSLVLVAPQLQVHHGSISPHHGAGVIADPLRVEATTARSRRLRHRHRFPAVGASAGAGAVRLVRVGRWQRFASRQQSGADPLCVVTGADKARRGVGDDGDVATSPSSSSSSLTSSRGDSGSVYVGRPQRTDSRPRSGVTSNVAANPSQLPSHHRHRHRIGGGRINGIERAPRFPSEAVGCPGRNGRRRADIQVARNAASRG